MSLGALVWLLAGSGCSDATGTGGSIEILRQPVHAVVDQVLSTPIEVSVQGEGGRPASGTVAIAIKPNPCDWPLGGTTTVPIIGGRATFSELTLGQVSEGYVLEAQWNSLEAATAPIDVAASGSMGPLTHENTLCTKPNEQKDAESLTYVAEDGSFWLADDDEPSIFRISLSGLYQSQFTADSILKFFPNAAQCDDGDGDPTTACSYIDEFEIVTHDPVNRLLYVLNTVNDEDADPVEDRPAIFVFRREGCEGCLSPVSWKPLPDSVNPRGLIAIEGDLYVAVGRTLYRYDYGRNEVLTVDEQGDAVAPVLEATNGIKGMGYDGAYLWMLLNPHEVSKVDWTSGVEVARYDIAPLGIAVLKGIQKVGTHLYILEGDSPNPIYVVRLPTP